MLLLSKQQGSANSKLRLVRDEADKCSPFPCKIKQCNITFVEVEDLHHEGDATIVPLIQQQMDFTTPNTNTNVHMH